MKSKEISHEIIDVPVDTNVKFRTSTDPGSYIPMHWHRAVEIIYMQEGSLDVTIESENFTIQKGDCIVINGNVLHSTKCTSPNTAILLQIPLDFMEKYIPNPGKLIFLFDFRTKDQRQQTKQSMFKTILEQLQIINDVRPDGYLLRFNSLMFELLFQLYHNFAVKILQNNTSQEKKTWTVWNLCWTIFPNITENPSPLMRLQKSPVSRQDISAASSRKNGNYISRISE